VAGRKAAEVEGKSGANRVLARGAAKAAGNNAGGVSIGKSLRAGENWKEADLYFDLARFFRAAFAAFFMFRFAAVRWVLVAIFLRTLSGIKGRS
jgi:hypothetical protein